MEDKKLEKLILEVLSENAGGFGLSASLILDYLPVDESEVSTKKIGFVCGGSKFIEMKHRNTNGTRWDVGDNYEG